MHEDFFLKAHVGLRIQNGFRLCLFSPPDPGIITPSSRRRFSMIQRALKIKAAINYCLVVLISLCVGGGLVSIGIITGLTKIIPRMYGVFCGAAMLYAYLMLRFALHSNAEDCSIKHRGKKYSISNSYLFITKH